MVHGFLVLALSSAEESNCRLLYSRQFGSDEVGRGEDPAGGEEEEGDLRARRLVRKERLAAVSRQVKSLCAMARQASEKPIPDFGSVIGEESIAVQEAEFGVFRLPAGDPFVEEKTVLWMGVLSLGFALICEAHENLMLAENTLKLIVKNLMECLKLLIHGNDILLKTDKIEMVLNTFLPHGQLMFINCCFIQSLDKELSICMSK
uniref:Protein C20orf29-like protein n=1 Tax=Callorhinchus milii TaxID=7868 RepID=V9L6E8_CALMI